MDRRVDRYNQSRANISRCGGGPGELNAFFWTGNVPRNILITGGTWRERYLPLQYLITDLVGRVPVIVLHKGNYYLADLIRDCCREAAGLGRRVPLGVVDRNSPRLEPLLGMKDTQIVETLEALAQSMQQSVPPEFDAVVRAHLAAVRLLDREPCLSGLYELCRIVSDTARKAYLMDAVPERDLDQAEQLWAQMGYTKDSRRAAAQLLCSVVNRLADYASESGWQEGNGESGMNLVLARAEGACFVLDVNESYGDLMLEYLTQELRCSRGEPYLLVLDDLNIRGKLLERLARGDNSFRAVITGRDVVGGTEKDRFPELAAGMELLVMFRQPEAEAAHALSAAIGTFERLITEHSYDQSRSLFDLLHHEERDGTTLRLDTEADRVTAAEIKALGPYQAILYDMATDSVIRFNG